jgi:hypothetical protein
MPSTTSPGDALRGPPPERASSDMQIVAARDGRDARMAFLPSRVGLAGGSDANPVARVWAAACRLPLTWYDATA